jgi:hypothetical protein
MMHRQITGHTKAHFTGTLFFVLLGSLVLFSCDLMLPIKIDFDTDTFNREWAAWEEQGIVNYTVLERASPRGTPAANITVRDNVIIDDDLPEDEWSWRSWFLTISEIYAYVDQKYEEALERIEADKGKKGGLRGIKITVTYNMEFHYPSYVRINRSFYENGVDGRVDITFNLSEFTPLAPAE